MGFPDPGVRHKTTQGWSGLGPGVPVPEATGFPFSRREARKPHSSRDGGSGHVDPRAHQPRSERPRLKFIPNTKLLLGKWHLLFSWTWLNGQPHPSCRPHPSQTPVFWGPNTLRALFLAPLAGRCASPAPAQTFPTRKGTARCQVQAPAMQEGPAPPKGHPSISESAGLVPGEERWVLRHRAWVPARPDPEARAGAAEGRERGP